MKRLLALVITMMLVMGTYSFAVEAEISLVPIPDGEPGSASNPLTPSETVRIYVNSSVALIALDAKLTIDEGPGTVTGAIGKAEAADYGWDPELSFDPDISGSTAEIGLGQFNGTQPGVVGFFDIHCDGWGNISVSLSPAMSFGGSGKLNPIGEVPTFDTTPLVIYQVPEPATMSLMGIGGLLLYRRKRIA